MTYKMRVHGQPTIFYEDEIEVEADSVEEAEEKAKDAFPEILDERFGWADIDTVFAEVLECR